MSSRRSPEGGVPATERWKQWAANRYLEFQKPIANPLILDRSFLDVVEAQPRSAVVLNLGSGESTVTTEAFVVNMDIEPFAQVNVVGDGHRLPFPDASFDCVFCNAVLEHVPYPQTVADEIRRVLKEGGLASIQVPFLEPIHAEADYFRFTAKGLQVLFRDLSEIKSGISAGPSQLIADAFQQYISIFFVGTWLFRPVWHAMVFLVFPVRLLDRLLCRRMSDRVTALARAFYFIGRK